MKKYVFTAGLPRAGTTLLGTILQQNPNVTASISGPLARFVRAIIQESSSQGGYRFECPPEKRKKLVHGLFATYYEDTPAQICVNHNRGWPLLLPTTKDLYPDSKMIICVRDMARIVNSFETLFRKNPYSFSSMYSTDESTNVYSRAEALLHPSRTLGFAYTAVKQGLYSDNKSDIMVLDYNQLASNPAQTLKAFYNFIGEPHYEHDFNDCEASYDEFDDEVQMPGLHTTRKTVSLNEPVMVLPPDLINMINTNFPSIWK